MFTVKFVSGTDGSEKLSMADSVDYFPKKQSKNDFMGVTTWLKGEPTSFEAHEDLGYGHKLYIMNEHGKTVATYSM